MGEEAESLSNERLIEDLHKEKRSHKGRTKGDLGLYFLLAVVLLAFVLYSLPKGSASSVISETTIHWHAKLNITERGTVITIPPSVGLLGDVAHPANLHTHDADNIVHLEIPGPVKTGQVMLGDFFDVWGRPKIKIPQMFVNGSPNSDGYDYVMHDGDVIEVIY